MTPKFLSFSLIIVLLTSLNTQAGVGDIAGGNSFNLREFLRQNRALNASQFDGDRILFQDYSTYVSLLYNSSICFDGIDYRAHISKCTKRSEDSTCIKSKKIKVFQPKESQRLRCTEFEDDNCVQFQPVPFIQPTVREILMYDSDGRLITRANLIVKDCQ